MENRDTENKSEISFFRCSGGHGSCWIIGMIALTVLGTGLWSAKNSGEETDLRMRRELVQQVVSLATAVNPENLRMLSFTSEDKNRPAFRLLCDQMAAYAEATGVRSLYTMALRDGQIVFGPENLPEGHPYASPPGTVFQEPSQKDFDIFTTARPQIQGPARDEYGTFVSASAPVVDRITGEVLAVVGIDVEAREWQAAVRRAQWISSGITLGLVAILFLSGLILRLRKRLSPEHAIRMRHAEPVLSAVFMSALTVVLAIHFNWVERNARRNTFYSIAQMKAAVSVAHFRDMNLMLEQLGCFFESCEEVSRAEFSTYCRTILQSETIQNCIWIPAVSNEFADAFVQTVRSGEMPDFSIWKKNANGMREPVSVRPVYYPVLYLEPTMSNAVLGYDECSDPARAAAIQRALNIGLNAATDPVVLVTSTNPQPAFLIFNSVSAAKQKGVVAFAVRPEKLLGGKKGELYLCLSQLRRGAEPLLLASTAADCGRACRSENKSGLSLTVPIFRFGKAYALNLTPGASWWAAHPVDSGWQVGWVGAFITVLVSSLVGLITNRRAKLEKMVEQRTAELRASEQLLEGVLNTIPARVFWKDKNLIYLGCNQAFANDAGLAAPQNIVGKEDDQMVWHEQAEFYRADDRFVIESGEPKLMIEESQTTSDGKCIELLTSKIPLRDKQGEICGVLGIYLDITERKLAEETLRQKLDELERFSRGMVDREMRMVSLKKEINGLLKIAGQPEKYRIFDEEQEI